MKVSLKRNTLLRFASILAAALVLLLSISIAAQAKSKLHRFKLVGGHFFGPGPIVPDTPLPDGILKNIKFNLKKFSGYANFDNDGSPESRLSDGKTKINQNIAAGVLNIGDGTNPVLLVAVKTGKNKGREYYRLADDYSFEWIVDLALDPGFAEGIITVEDFVLTTGLVKIARSAQTENNIPGGYDQAGSLRSGQYLAGRVGDFNQDGFMDGIVVAAPRVPLESNMLPGSPVGNQRGFETDVKIPAHLACELTLRGIAQFKGPLSELSELGLIEEIGKMLKDIEGRLNAARVNMDRALMKGGPWSQAEMKADGFLLSDRLEAIALLNLFAFWMIDSYPVYGAALPSSAADSLSKLFVQLDDLITKVSATNAKTDHVLPRVGKRKTKDSRG